MDRTVPSCPDHLGDVAREEWARIVPKLVAAGLFTSLDRSALAGYCAAYGRWVEAETELKKHGVLVRSPSGYPMVSPYFTVANRALEQMTRLLVEFGLSPSSRTRVGAAATPDQPVAEDHRIARYMSVIRGGRA